MIQKDIFSRLKRLFSNDVIIRNIGGNQLRTIDTERIQAYGNVKTNSLIDRFSRIHRTGQSSLYNPTLSYQTLRIQLYSDYEAMDTDAIIASALDILSDECTLKNESGEVLQIRSSDETIQKILYNLFYDVLNIEFNLWTWIRNMCKYGDFYLFMQIAEKFGVYNIKPLSSYDIIREEGMDPNNPSYVCYKFDTTTGTNSRNNPIFAERTKFESYEIAHFRLLADANYLPYGRSYIEPARKVWKQLTLMEDAMLVHRIMRAPEKRTFYVDVGSIPPNEVDAYMQKLVQSMKKTPFQDQQTGEYNLKYNIQNILEDFYIPVRGQNSGTKIDTAKGLEYNAIEDVNYLRDKMLASLKIPKAFFGYEKDLTGKATLAAEDIRFARTIERIQRIVVSELTKIALVHLYTQGYDGESLTNFDLSLTTPSIIYEQERISLFKEKVELAANMQATKLIPSDYIYDKIFQFSEDQYDEMRDLVLEDKKREFRLQQIETEGNDPSKTGKSYGTPHDIAMLQGISNVTTGNNDNIPKGYDEKKQGRPKEKPSLYNTQEHPLGKDVTGKKAAFDTPKPNPNQPEFKGGSPLALNFESTKTSFMQNKDMFARIPKKQIIFEGESDKPGMLSEENIRDED